MPAGEHARRFNAPTLDEVAIVIVGDEFKPRDIVLHRRDDRLVRIAETHRCYDALQYPILFWDGADGYHLDVKMVDPLTGSETQKKCSATNFYSHRIMIRQDEDNYILRCRQLFHQYIVDMYAKIETERLVFLRFHQMQLRSEDYIHLRDAVLNDGNATDVGRLTILPSSYIGSPRHMHEYAQDALAYVRCFGRPDLFITFTCNVNWDDIRQLLLPGQSPMDRHDIIARVFRQKLKSLMNFIVKHKVFGSVCCWMYSVEWQKRGFPHAHILIWLINKIKTDQIDDVICAELPDAEVDRPLHEVVVRNMIHGPCGTLNPASPCMIDGKCSKRYPRPFVTETITGTDGYPLYRRRFTEDGGRVATIHMRNATTEVDNRWVVPYSPLLSKTYKAHINVEYCTSVKSIKYICKYVCKGCDMAVFGIQPKAKDTNAPAHVDEIANYQAGRYISSNEAVWRILSFPMHERGPAVVHLAVHLENGQRVYFTAATVRQKALNPPSTTLTAFFSLCQDDTFASTLLYSEVPTYYTWDTRSKCFHRRKRGEPVLGHPDVFKETTIGRLYTVHPNQDECFFLRMLLVNVGGPTSFQQLKTVDGVHHDTFRGACKALNLLEDDRHWDSCVNEACYTSYPNQIRTLFAIILTACSPSSPVELWETYKPYMAEDIFHRMTKECSPPRSLDFVSQKYNEVLILIENLCLRIANKALRDLGMPSPTRSAAASLNVELHRELHYDLPALTAYVVSTVSNLTDEQRVVFDQVVDAVNGGLGGIFFLDAPGGTGKTHVVKSILAKIRSESGVALALASSGIAATLFPGGRTAHSALKLPLNMQFIEAPTCNISKSSGMHQLLQKCKLIVWDECTMAHKKSLEALDRSLRDIRGNNRPFGKTVVLLSGDFKQTLPVIPRSTPADEINACLKFSGLWRHVKPLKLTTNMRVLLRSDTSSSAFSQQLLDIGNGKLPVDPISGRISLPFNFCNFVSSRSELIEKVFPALRRNYLDRQWLSERAILAPKNKDVNELNDMILSCIPGEVITYRSIDTIVEPDDAVNYPLEFLNSLDPPGMPPHLLQLKVGAPIILLRNIDPPRLCNGTRLVIKQLLGNVLQATIITGPFLGEDVLIPRIPMIPTDSPFEFRRLQFPVRPAFAITINKAQGQSLEVCGLDLATDCFSHGQLYVACSRVGDPNNLYVLSADGSVKNIVFLRVLSD